MPLFSRNYDKPGPGVEKDEEPKTWYIQFLLIYFRKFSKLAQLNLLFLIPVMLVAVLMVVLYFLPGHVALGLSSAENGMRIDLWSFYVVPFPLILLSPFVAGLTIVTRNFSREEHAFIWWDFWDAVKNNWKPFLLNGLVCYTAYAILSFAMLYYYNNAVGNSFYYVPFGIALLFAVLFLFMQYYIPVMIVTFDLNLRQIYRNAAIFIFAGLWRNLVITAVFAALIVGFAMIPISVLSAPFLIALLIFWLFSFAAYLVNFMVYPVIDQYLIQPQLPENRDTDPVRESDAEDESNDLNKMVFVNGKLVKKVELHTQDR